jgi:hypothetical protein
VLIGSDSFWVGKVCISSEHFQETLSILQYALKLQESLDYREPSRKQQDELLDRLATAVETLEGYSNQLQTSCAENKVIFPTVKEV